MWAWTRKGKKLPVDCVTLSPKGIDRAGHVGVRLSTGLGIDEEWSSTIELANKKDGEGRWLGALFGHWVNELRDVHESHWATCPNSKQHKRG